MFPQLMSTLLNWTEQVQMKVILKKAVDFELQEDVLSVPTLEMMLQVMAAREVDRKPEGERAWKWFDGWSDVKVQKDTVMQDPEGLEYRVDSVTDWSQAGFYKYDLVQQPYGL